MLEKILLNKIVLSVVYLDWQLSLLVNSVLCIKIFFATVPNLESLKLIETVKGTQPIGIIEFELPARNKSERRQVKQAIYIKKVRLSPPDRKRKRTRYQIVETNVIIASEIDTPPNHPPLEWILLTNVPINNAVDGYEMVKWYLCRWQIEIYFRILKSGCKVEKLQLEKIAL